MSTITLAEVKSALNKTGTGDDVELQRIIDAAEAEYTEWVGPLTGTVTETFDGGATSVVLRYPNVSAVDAATYTDGTSISTADLSLDTATGIVYWGYGTAGRFTSGTRNVTLTYTVGTLPANHREAIIADVAGYFAATQRGGGAVAASFPGEGFDVERTPGSPVVLFPRIRAIGSRYPGIA